MKTALALLVALVSLQASAADLINCLNPATGAALVVSEYSPRAPGAAVPPNALMEINAAMIQALQSQGVAAPEAVTTGIAMLGRGLVEYDAQDINGLSVTNGYPGQGGLLTLTAKNGANFKFNAGECSINAM